MDTIAVHKRTPVLIASVIFQLISQKAITALMLSTGGGGTLKQSTGFGLCPRLFLGIAVSFFYYLKHNEQTNRTVFKTRRCSRSLKVASWVIILRPAYRTWLICGLLVYTVRFIASLVYRSMKADRKKPEDIAVTLVWQDIINTLNRTVRDIFFKVFRKHNNSFPAVSPPAWFVPVAYFIKQ